MARGRGSEMLAEYRSDCCDWATVCLAFVMLLMLACVSPDGESLESRDLLSAGTVCGLRLLHESPPPGSSSPNPSGSPEGSQGPLSSRSDPHCLPSRGCPRARVSLRAERQGGAGGGRGPWSQKHGLGPGLVTH